MSLLPLRPSKEQAASKTKQAFLESLFCLSFRWAGKQKFEWGTERKREEKSRQSGFKCHPREMMGQKEEKATYFISLRLIQIRI